MVKIKKIKDKFQKLYVKIKSMFWVEEYVVRRKIRRQNLKVAFQLFEGGADCLKVVLLS
jgi:hypothetical protein